MAFRTNKVPAIEERSVSGSSVSFNSAFALPLKACKVSFSATQAGSGDPSPSNPYTISGVSGLNLSANSVPVSVNFGGERFGGELDVLTGELTITHGKYILDGSVEPYTANWRPQSNSVGCFWNNLFTFNPPATSSIVGAVMCDKLVTVSYSDIYSNDIDSIALLKQIDLYRVFIRIKDLTLTTKEAVVDYLTHNPITIVYELESAITIQLSANELSSIIGNNTFSTDTGTLEITFADLQEKSASGAVATFNTALAMPLASCNIAVNAWQEGSGDPSPVNNRPIHGYDKLHINMCNFNQLLSYKDVSFTAADVNFSRSNNYWSAVGLASSDITDSDKCFNTVPAVIGHKYILGILASDKIKSYDYYSSSFNNRKSGLYMINNVNPTIRLRVCLESGVQYNETFSGIVIDLTQLLGTKLADELYQMEQTETGTGVALFKQIFYKDYYDYNVGGTWVSVASVNGDSYPDYAEKNLGETVYGGSYNIDGTKRKIYEKVVFDGSEDENWLTFGQYGFQIYLPTMKSGLRQYGLCNWLKVASASEPSNTVILGSNSKYIYLNDLTRDILPEVTTVALLREYLAEHNLEITYPLIEPIETDIGATPISTNIGNNTIFADTGDVDLTYKDLDIAKRGNFREVFKLPS